MSESFDEFLSRVLDRAVLCLRPRSDEFVKIFKHLRLLATKTCERSGLRGHVLSQNFVSFVDPPLALIARTPPISIRTYVNRYIKMARTVVVRPQLRCPQLSRIVN